MGKREYVTPLAHGLAHAGIGNDEEAFAYLSKAIEERAVRAAYLNVDPYFKPLQKDARFAALVDQLRLNNL